MTGPEHYRAAEQLIRDVRKGGGQQTDVKLLAEAQTHATLALAAATAGKTHKPGLDTVVAWNDIVGRN